MLNSEKLKENFRIIFAITAKDIIDGIKNRTTLSIMLTAVFLALFYHFISLVKLGNGLPNVIVADAGYSSLADELDENRDLNFYIFHSQAVMQEKLAKGGDAREIGLVLPASIDSTLGENQTIDLEGYRLHWATDGDVNEVVTLAETVISELVDRPIRIRLEENVVYARTDSFGHPFNTSIALVFITLMIGATFTPNLMIEEKRTKALEALMVSPAKASHMVLGKAVAGLFYSLLGTALVLFINGSLVVHWDLLLLVTFIGSLTCVTIGLLLGTIFEARQQLSLWGFILLQPLAIPMFLLILTDLLPDWLVTLFGYIPTVAFMSVVRLSFTEKVPLSEWGGLLLIVLGYGLALFLGTVWLIRRSDK